MVTSLFKKSKKILKKGQAALPVILVIGGVIVLIGTSLSLRSYLEQKTILSDKNSKEALMAAESGINDALIRLSRDKTLDTSYELSISNTTKANVAISKNKPSFNQTTITSLGSSNQSQRELQCIVQIDEPTGNLKLVSCQEIALSAASDTNPPTVGVISPTNATATQAVVLSSSVSDNTIVSSCNLFINNLDQGAMSLSQTPCASCTASKTYTFTSSGSYSAYTKCYDLVGNSATSTAVTINVASACSLPTAGTVTPSNTSYGSYVDSPFDLSTAFTSSCTITSCQYTTDGSTWNSATVSGSAPNYTCTQTGITGSNGASLTLNMRATNAAGTTTATAVSRTVDAQAPTDGTLSACGSNQTVYLIWSGFSDSGSGLASSNTYKLVYQTGSAPSSCSAGTQLYLGTATSYTHTGLTNGTTYYYRVCAYDNVGNLSTGAIASATPKDACGGITSVTFTYRGSSVTY